jgi:hypothetical protein
MILLLWCKLYFDNLFTSTIEKMTASPKNWQMPTSSHKYTQSDTTHMHHVYTTYVFFFSFFDGRKTLTVTHSQRTDVKLWTLALHPKIMTIRRTKMNISKIDDRSYIKAFYDNKDTYLIAFYDNRDTYLIATLYKLARTERHHKTLKGSLFLSILLTCIVVWYGTIPQ